MKQFERCEKVLHEALDHGAGTKDVTVMSGNNRVMMYNKIFSLYFLNILYDTIKLTTSLMYVRMFAFFPFQTSPVSELQVLSDDCRYLVLLAKIQSKVEKKEEALLSLERVSASVSVLLETVWTLIQTAD